jgi:hypothetical protein
MLVNISSAGPPATTIVAMKVIHDVSESAAAAAELAPISDRSNPQGRQACRLNG